jgi:hypothetical protein
MPGKTLHLIAAALLATALVAVPPSIADTLYGADGAQGHSSNLYILDPSTGAVSSTVGPIGFAVTGMAMHPMTGVLYGSTSNNSPVAPGSLIRIDKATGAGTLIGSFGFKPGLGTLADITFTSDGTLYGWGSINANGDLWTVNLATGAATRVGNSGEGGNNGGALAADASDTLYLCIIEDDDFLRTVNRATGVDTKVAKLDGTTDDPFSAMKFNSAGKLYAARLHSNPSPKPSTATLVTIDKASGHITAIGPTVDRLDAIVFACSAPVFGVPMVASILPSSRSVQVGTTATAYVTIINAGTAEAVEVGISPKTPIAANFAYQSTDCGTNILIPGTTNVPVDIAPGGQACFAIFLTPTSPFDPVEVAFSFAGCNTTPVTDIPDVNTFLFSGSATPVPDIVAQAVTLSGDGIVNVAGTNGTGVFAVSVSDVGISANITASVDFGGAVVNAIVTICQTDPATGVCLSPPASSASFPITGPVPPGTATFGVFVQGTGFIPFDPANIRIFVRFRDAGGVIRGATSVAVRTQ